MKFLLKLFLILSILFSSLIDVFAHPLDVSSTYTSIRGENNIDVTTYLHSYEVWYLLKENWIKNYENLQTFYNNSEIITKYVEDNITVYNNNWPCMTYDYKVLKDLNTDILTDWLRVSYKFGCDKPIENLYVDISFFDNFPLQTNKLTLSKWLDDLYFKVLTPKITSLELDINNISNTIIDSDDDWLSDEEELIYKTDPKNRDSDFDEFTDKEEIDNWRNPLNKEASPGQDMEPKREEGFLDNLYWKQVLWETNDNKNRWLNDNSKYFGWEFLWKTLAAIDDFLAWDNNNFLLVFGMVMTLWIIHAAWPGHSKSLLVGYVLSENKWKLNVILYALIFSVVHILDILLLYFIYKFGSEFIDLSNFTKNIAFYSWIMLIMLSGYLLYSKVLKKKSCNNHSNKESLLTAAIAWLLPCSFWWSIFILLVSIGQTGWIFPLIIALWLWIFITLSSIWILAFYLKERLYHKIEVLSKYSLIVSIAIIFTVGVLMIF